MRLPIGRVPFKIFSHALIGVLDLPYKGPNMYYSLVFVLALAAVAAGSGYIVGREYVYRYHGYSYTGFPDRKSQYAVNAFDSRIVIQPRGGYAVYTIEDLKYAVVNKEIENIGDYHYEYKELSPQAVHLKKPFKVYYKHGQVQKFEVSKGEPAFSVNLKRGIISLFNLNFDEAESINLSENYNEVYRPEETAHYYKIYEDGVLGDCETQYVIEHHPSHLTPHNNIVLNVTKSRNYHKCRTAPNHHYGTFHGRECGNSDYEKPHTLHGNAYYHYDIRGDRHHYVIEHIETEGEVLYVPYPLEGQVAEISTNRSVELLEEHDVSHQNEVEAEVDSYDHLHYDIPFQHHFKDDVDLKKPHYLFHLYGRKAPKEEVTHLFEELVKDHDDDSHKQKTKDTHYPALFLELVRAVSTYGYEDIEELYHTYADFTKEEATAEKVRSRSLFYDVLVSTGTNPALLFGKYLIHNHKVSNHVVLYFLQNLPKHTKELNEKLLDEIEALCEDEHVRNDRNAYATCYASLSTLIYDHCVARYHPEHGLPHDEYECPEDIPHKFFTHFDEKLEHTHDEFLEVVYLKAIGNLGVKEAIKHVKPYADGENHESDYVRNAAIWALKNAGHHYPDLVRGVIVPLYYNHSESALLRITSFILLMSFHPSTFELETIARDLLDEEDCQLRSYVYSTFNAYVNSTHPCDRQLSHDVRYALYILKHSHQDFEHYDYSYSHFNMAAGYDHNYDYGGSTKFAYIASDTGYIPRTAYLGLSDFIGGKALDTFGIGFKQWGLEKFTDKLFGPEGAFGRRSLFDLFHKREKREVSNVDKEKREIQEKLHLPTKEYEPIHGEIFFKYMGSQTSFYYFNESTFEDFFRQGAFDIPDLATKFKNIPEYLYRRFTLAVDKLYYIPSEIGLPVIFDYKQPEYFSHENKELKFEVNPSFWKDERNGKWPTDVHLKVDGHFICDKNLFASVGFALPFEEVVLETGINRRCTLSLPIKMDFSLDVKDFKFKAKWTPVVPHEVYHFHYEPYTAIDSYRKYVSVDQQPNYLPVRLEGYRKNYYKKYLHDELGFGLKAHKDYDTEWNDFGSWFRFLTQKDYREKFYYLYANPHFEPYHYDLVLEEADHDATKEVEATFTYDYAYTNDHRPEAHKPDADFEEYDNVKFTDNYITSYIRGELLAHGEKERQIHAEAIYSRDFQRRFHKMSVYYDRTPFASYENEGFKLCLSGYMKYPHVDRQKLAHLETIDLERTIDKKIKIHFGKDCHTDEKITIHGKHEPSEQQLDLERRREEPDTVEHHNPYSHLYHECQHDKHPGYDYPQSCIDYMFLAVQAHKHTYHITHEHLSPRFLNMTYKLGGYISHLMYDYSDHNVIDVNNPENEYHVEANYSALYPVFDLRVRKPHSESHYTHVPDPCYHPISVYPFIEDIRTIKSANDHMCMIQGKHVYTFDHFTYDLPDIDCYKVLAKDASPNDHFMVLGAKITHPRFRKAVKVFLGKHKVEALPVSDESDIIIRVDGKKVAVTDDEPYYYYEEGTKHPVFYITHRDFYYALHSEKYGLIVEYDGQFINIQVSPFYRSKLTGICGNYNGQKYDGYDTEKGCHIHDSDNYAYTFAIPSDTCHPHEVKKDCYGEGGAGCTELRTKVVTLTTGKVPQTCFSTEPIPQCREGCVPEGTVHKTLGFHCLPSKDDSTKKLLRQQESRVLYEVRRKSQDHEEDVEIPEKCHRQ